MQEMGNSDVSYKNDENWIDGQDEKTAQIRIWNTPGVALPSTGGPGNNRIYLLGIMLISLAGAGLVITKRKRSAV